MTVIDGKLGRFIIDGVEIESVDEVTTTNREYVVDGVVEFDVEARWDEGRSVFDEILDIHGKEPPRVDIQITSGLPLYDKSAAPLGNKNRRRRRLFERAHGKIFTFSAKDAEIGTMIVPGNVDDDDAVFITFHL